MASTTASAADVALELSTRQAFVGQRVTVRIQISGANRVEGVEFPALEGATVRGPDTGHSSSIQIINGRMTQQATYTYTYAVIPRQPGVLTIPPIIVRADGQVHPTPPQTIQVTRSETGDLMFLRLRTDRESVYFGEAIDVELEIWLKVYKDRNARDGVDAEGMLSMIQVADSEWGRFEQTVGKIQRGELRWQYRPGSRLDDQGVQQDYFVYGLPLKYVPATAGPLDVGEVSVLASYPTGTRLDRDFFGQRSIRLTGTRPIQATLETGDILVLAPPDEGRPPYFNGAVGQYRFSVEARNTIAREREPIELTLTIEGQGELDRVPAPPLTEIDELTRDFKVPEEHLTGVADQNRKRFVVTVRAKSTEVTEIPSLPFAYFDPVQEKYVTLRSDPIPVRITASEQVTIAQFDSNGNAAPQAAAHLTQTGAGIQANYVDMDQVLGQQAFDPGIGSAAVLIGSPVAYVVAVLVQRRRLRLRHDQGYARRRQARARALAAVGAPGRHRDGGTPASDVAAAVIGYISDRCNLPTGLTRSEATRHLVDRQVNVERVKEVEALLRHCEDLQYAGTDGAASADLPERARRCIQHLDQERF